MNLIGIFASHIIEIRRDDRIYGFALHIDISGMCYRTCGEGYSKLLVLFRTGHNTYPDTDRGYWSDHYGLSGFPSGWKKDQSDAEADHTECSIHASGRRIGKTYQICDKGYSHDRDGRGCAASTCICKEIRDGGHMVCCFPFGIGLLQCRI